MSYLLQPIPPPPSFVEPKEWPGRTLLQPRKSIPTISSEIWPQRLLHVPSMTSHIREDLNKYNGVQAPDYNVLSYTWGRFSDSAEIAISVAGVDWPIPAVRKEHFTADTFKAAIERAASGIRHPCEWLWVDIACIPQRHSNETEEARLVRGQEIGRQVDIFRRAKEAFAWLTHLKTSDICEGQPFMTVRDIINQFMQGFEVRSAEDASSYLDTCEHKFRFFETYWGKLLSHPWLSSLWTLQEMTIRKDIWILFDDGFLDLSQYESSFDIAWRLFDIKSDVHTMYLDFNTSESTWEWRFQAMRRAERLALSKDFQNRKGYTNNMRERYERLLNAQLSRGLYSTVSAVPNAVYSVARNRNVTMLTDRIYGIVQIYGIACNPSPVGENETAQLNALEDEFGAKLVAESALMSQSFICCSKDPPRRSWLITQNCVVDQFWEDFYNESNIINELSSLSVVEPTGNVRFDGKAWNLASFFQSKGHNSFGRQESKKRDMSLGLILDHHVSERVLGQVIEYFASHAKMLEAIQDLSGYYGKSLRIALLGSRSPTSIPTVHYIGLVLAPLKNLNGSPEWIRIGLVRWDESYSVDNNRPHYDLPSFHDFHCVIV